MSDYDEEFDAQLDVEQNPCGAWQAIQELTAERDLYKARAERAEGALEEGISEPSQPTVKPLEWHKSRVSGWNDDWHTVPTAYTIRCADENGWKWSTPLGAFGCELSPDAAKAAAQADYERRILSAIEYRQPTVQEAARVLVENMAHTWPKATHAAAREFPHVGFITAAGVIGAALRALAEGDNQ